MLKTQYLWTMTISTICKQCSVSPQNRILKLSTSALTSVSHSLGQTASKSNVKLNRNHNLAVENNLDLVQNRKPRLASSCEASGVSLKEDLDSEKLNKRRLKIGGVVEKAENLLGYRLNRLNNSIFLKSLSSASSIANANGFASLFGEESSVILPSIQKLEGTGHPLLNYFRGVNPDNLENSDILTSSFQLRSMVVLLVAKAFGFSNSFQNQTEVLDSIKAKQKVLAEITEIIYAAHMLHRTVVEIPKEQFPTLGKVVENTSSTPPKGIGASLHQGNKVATLMGDLLLAKSSKGLASLRNAKVTESMSESIEDFTESEILVCKVNKSLEVLTKNVDQCNSESFSQVLNYEKWLQRSKLSIGSLLGHSCFGSLVFAGHEDELVNVASSIGIKIGLALQAYKDYSIFESDRVSSHNFDLCMLPVIYFLERNSQWNMFDDLQMYEEIRTDSYAAARTKETLLLLLNDAQKSLLNLNQSPSSKLLAEFLKSLSS